MCLRFPFKCGMIDVLAFSNQERTISMLLFIQCIIACAIFTALILPPLYKNPMIMLSSYPTAIRKRVESLPQYQDIAKPMEKKQIYKKIVFAIVCTIVLAIIAYYSGAKTFKSAFIHIFILFSSVNIFDVFVLDLGLFCHSKKTIIPGTEDMIDEYRKPWHHLIGGVYGTVIGLVVSLISSFYVYLFGIF